jgi:SET domain-containing protein
MINVPPSYRKDFLNHLQNNTFCRLGKSEISGVGVFALTDIPQKINPFCPFPFKEEFFIDVSEEELHSLKPEVQQYIKDFFAQDSRGLYPVNATGLNDLNITHYVNHSNESNLEVEADPFPATPHPPSRFMPSNGALNSFLTKRKISKNEELTCNYNDFLSVNNNTGQFNFLFKRNEASIPIYKHKGGKV